MAGVSFSPWVHEGTRACICGANTEVLLGDLAFRCFRRDEGETERASENRALAVKCHKFRRDRSYLWLYGVCVFGRFPTGEG